MVVADPQLEARVFWILVYIMKEQGWREMYDFESQKYKKVTATLVDRVKTNFPRVHEKILNAGLDYTVCFV